MVISELNYCESVSANEVTGGGFFGRFRLDVDKDVNVDVRNRFETFATATGNSAEVTGEAIALGDDTSAQVLSFTRTTPFSSLAAQEALSVTA